MTRRPLQFAFGVLAASLLLFASATAGNVNVTQQGAGVILSDDDAVAIARPAPDSNRLTGSTAATAPTAAPVKPAVATTGNSPAVSADKPDPRLQHRESMLREAEPDAYMSGNPAVSRRYLMIDRKTYEQRNAN